MNNISIKLEEKIFWRRKWQPTPVFWPGKSHGQRRLMDYSPWGLKESDMTEQLTHTHTHTHTHTMTYPQISEQVKAEHLSRAEMSVIRCPRKQRMEGRAEIWWGKSKLVKELRSGSPGSTGGLSQLSSVNKMVKWQHNLKEDACAHSLSWHLTIFLGIIVASPLMISRSRFFFLVPPFHLDRSYSSVDSWKWIGIQLKVIPNYWLMF